MEDILSIFTDKSIIPTNDDLKEKLGDTYSIWMDIYYMVYNFYPKGKEDWNYPGKKYGWSFRIKDNRRAILYFLPRNCYFKVAFVFGQKAVDKIVESNISDSIKRDLISAKKYVEGRGVSIDVKNDLVLPDIEKLIEIKLAY